MSDSNIKGTALEQATRAIEEMVIRAQPGIAQAPFSIETRAKVPVGEQRYEFDVLVRINERSPYETTHVFECKNTKEPVGRDVVMVFAAKAATIGAARGTIVGRVFTKEAEFEAKKHPNIELVPFNDDIWFPLGALQAMGLSHHFTRFQTTAIRHPQAPDTPAPEWVTALCNFQSASIPFTQLAHNLANRWMAESSVFRQSEGSYTGTATPAYEFDDGELTVGTWPIRVLALDFDYSASIKPARLVSTFSIEKRGRFARLECERDAFDGAQIALEFLGKP